MVHNLKEQRRQLKELTIELIREREGCAANFSEFIFPFISLS
jgi:hypothetical protein